MLTGRSHEDDLRVAETANGCVRAARAACWLAFAVTLSACFGQHTREAGPTGADSGEAASTVGRAGPSAQGLHDAAIAPDDGVAADGDAATVDTRPLPGDAGGADTTSATGAAREAECLALFSYAGPECTNCMCQPSMENDGEGGCRDEILRCVHNPDTVFADLCGDLLSCVIATGCSGVPCYAPDTCMRELDAVTAGYGGFPFGCTDFGADQAPCPAATDIWTCKDMRSACWTLCEPPRTM